MKLIKLGAAVLNQTPLDWESNHQHIIGAIAAARKQNITILCLPELCITGYGCEDAFYAPHVCHTALDYLNQIVPFTQGMIVSVGLPLKVQNKLFNVACLIANGEILGFVAKKFLAGNGIHYEPRWFTPWPQGEHTTIMIEGKSYKVGDIYFNISGIRIGFEICEDAWVASRPGRELYKRGVDIILNPSASHFAFQKLDIRKRFVLEGSRSFGVSYVYANLLGNEAGRAIYDGGALIASNGSLMAVGKRFTFADFDITSAVVDVEITRLAQMQSPTSFSVEISANAILADFDYPVIQPQYQVLEEEAWESSPYIKEEEFARALTLSLYDYMRKSYSRGFVVSLSGGADSSAVTCLSYMMIYLGVQDIGIEAFTKKISYIKNIESKKSVEELAQMLITCAYQGTENSSNTTFTAASELAKAVHAVFHNLNINGIVETYTNIIETSLGRELTWQEDDVTLQNIQARVRAPSVWMLANIKNALLIATSNRSEVAVGYATMDGDTAGGLSPIAGIDKIFLRKWLVWLEKIGVGGELKIPALSYVNVQAPTAELRPKDSKQTDEKDLMPYDVLEEIEKAAIRDKKSPVECLASLLFKYPDYTKQELKGWIDKFFRLWCRNQWKRERYAPSFHLDDKNLDPKTWCRFPILSGGFAKELEELWSS